MFPSSCRPGRLRPGLTPVLYLLLFAAVALGHLSLLHLPYFWDEGGYYVPAALDFFHRWTLIPEFTNAHPPLPSIVLGLAWRLFGFHILVTRLVACAFAAGGLLAVFELAKRLLSLGPALVVTALTAVYPIWYAQSSLAHADIFAAAFTLAGFAAFLTAPELDGNHGQRTPPSRSSADRLLWAAAFFCLSVLAKETAVVQPVGLALFLAARLRSGEAAERPNAWRWLLALCSPVPVLAVWFAYHRWKTGFTFGNPEYLRYNATANLTFRHLLTSFGYRAMHLFWQRSIWLPLLLAAACLLLPRQAGLTRRRLPPQVLACIAVLVTVNWIAFSVLGGALLTRYLLPVYPLLLLVAVSLWWERTVYWLGLAALTAAAFLSGLWINPPTYFAPEDNLTYRDMIVVHQEAIAWLQQHAPDATVLTAWPAAAELFRPELGYTQHRFKVVSIENFSPAEIGRMAQEPGKFDTALVFTTHYVTPAYRQYLLTHPNSRRGREYGQKRDLSPAEIARILGGRIVWQDDRDGEWAAILQFNRRYDALALPPCSPSSPDPSGPPCPHRAAFAGTPAHGGRDRKSRKRFQ